MAIKELLIEKSDRLLTVLEIGSSKIICIIASVSNAGIKVVGHGCHSANGFKNGNISDTKLAKESIISAIEQAELEANFTVESVILIINGNKVRSHYLTPSLNLSKRKITSAAVEDLVFSGIRDLEKKGNQVIHFCSLGYNVDGNNMVRNPVGLIGSKVIANIHYVTASSIMLENIINCLASCQLDIEDCVFAPFASSYMVLNNNDKEIGSTVIDIGGQITSYALFTQGNVVACGYIPIGGDAITNDISKSFMMDILTAERIKTIHGAAKSSYADKNKMISYKNEGNVLGGFEVEERTLSNIELNNVIHARLEEIFTYLKRILADHYQQFPNARHNVIITGGTTSLNGIGEETSRILETKVRVGKFNLFEGLPNDITKSSYAAIAGALKMISQNESELEVNQNEWFLKGLIAWFRRHF